MRYFFVIFIGIILSVQSCKFMVSLLPKKKTAEWYYEQGVVEKNNTNSYVAINNFNKAIKVRPHYYDAYYKRAETYLSMDSIDSAVRDYDSLLVITTTQEDRGRLFYLKGNALYLNSRDSLACICYVKSKDLNYTPAWNKVRNLCR